MVRADSRTARLRRARIGALTLAALAAGCGPARVELAPAPVRVEPPPLAAGSEDRDVPAPPPAGALWVAAVGDIQMGEEAPADPAAGPLAAAAPFLRDADLALGNLEGPLTTQAPAKCRRASSFCFAFTTPPDAADHLARVGFHVLSLANNHALDAGEPGRAETIGALGARGIRSAGGFAETALSVRGRPEAAPARRVAVLGFATAAHSPDLRDPGQVTALVRRAAAEHELVVVFFHGGAEGPDAARVPHGPERYLNEDRGDLRAFARLAIDAGADLVVGSGPHVLRGLETYRGRLIAYSLGNFAGGGRLSTRGVRAHTGVLLACLDGRTGRFLAGRWAPFQLDGRGVPRPDPKGESVRFLRELTRRDFPETAVGIDDDGTLTPPDFAPDDLARCGEPPGQLSLER